MGANVTMSAANQWLKFEGNVDVPHPNKDTHTLVLNVRPSEDLNDFKFKGEYQTVNYKGIYGGVGAMSWANPEHVFGNVTVIWDIIAVGNYAEVKRSNGVSNFLYKLKTPKFVEETVVARLIYKSDNLYHNIS